MGTTISLTEFGEQQRQARRLRVERFEAFCLARSGFGGGPSGREDLLRLLFLSLVALALTLGFVI